MATPATSRRLLVQGSSFDVFSHSSRTARTTYQRARLSSTSRQHAEPSKDDTPIKSPLHDFRRMSEGLPWNKRPQVQIQKALYDLAKERGVPIPNELKIMRDELEDSTGSAVDDLRLPRAVELLHLAPLKREPTHGIPVCNLQIRSFSARNLELMADFALRAAYYLDLPAKGPVPLPRIVERWTVPRSVFVHKKAQENWERITMRRLIQIQDGHPEVVQRWLAFVRKHQWYGVGMKADVWQYEDMNVVKNMEANEEAIKQGLEGSNWELFGRRKGLGGVDDVARYVDEHGFATAQPPKKPVQEQRGPKQPAKAAKAKQKASEAV